MTKSFNRLVPLLLSAVLTVAACVWVYGQTTGFGFLGGEDNAHIGGFREVSQEGPLDGWRTIATTLRFGQWIPLGLASHKIDCLLFGLDAGKHHLVNVGLHAACCLLLLGLVRQLRGGWCAALCAALLLAVHPQHVQLVAWIAERKDLLAYLLALGSLACYIRWVQVGGGRLWYLAALALFSMALASRFLVAGLPFLLLALDAGPLRDDRELSLRRAILEKTPFLLLGAAFVAGTWYLHHPQNERFGIDHVGILPHLLAVCWNLLLYLWNTVDCAALTFINRFPLDLPLWLGVSSALAIVFLTAAVWVRRANLPWWGSVWIWHLAALLPVCGIQTLGPNFHSDHYSYLPHIGLFLLLALAIGKLPRRPQLLAAAIVLCLSGILAGIARKQTRSYSSLIAIAEREIEVGWDRGDILAITGSMTSAMDRPDLAERSYRRVVELGADRYLVQAYRGLAEIAMEKEDYPTALTSLRAAIAASDKPLPQLESWQIELERLLNRPNPQP